MSELKAGVIHTPHDEGMSVTEIKNKEARAEVKAALELVKKANELCKEAKG